MCTQTHTHKKTHIIVISIHSSITQNLKKTITLVNRVPIIENVLEVPTNIIILYAPKKCHKKICTHSHRVQRVPEFHLELV